MFGWFAAFASLTPLTLFAALHTGLYTCVQHQVYRTKSFLGLEAAVPPVKRGAFKELALTTAVDAGIILHTFGAIRFGNAFQTGNLWIDSQYALEITVKLIESAKLLWNPSLHSHTELLAHHAVSLALLATSYASNHTTLGFAILSATNLSNVFFDYFKYGLLTDDPAIRWMSSVVFWAMFFMSRIYILGGDILLPLFTRSNLLYTAPLPLAGFYGSTLLALYGFQLYWFYRLTLHTWRNTVRLFQRPSLEAQMKTDFLQLIQHLTDAETTIQRHLRSHAFAETEGDASEPSDALLENEQSGTSATSGTSSTSGTSGTSSTLPADIEPFDIQSFIQHASKKMSEEDAIIDEALSQWRACIFKTLNDEKTKKET